MLEAPFAAKVGINVRDVFIRCELIHSGQVGRPAAPNGFALVVQEVNLEEVGALLPECGGNHPQGAGGISDRVSCRGMCS